MRIALLYTDEYIGEWFSVYYPHVAQYDQVNLEFLKADCLIIVALYFIKDEHFNILNLWERFLRQKEYRGKRLLVLGWSPSEAKNYLKAASMPVLTKEVLEKFPIAGGKREHAPSYPELKDRDILKLLGRVMHSHGDRAFLKLLGDAQRSISKIEGSIARGKLKDDKEVEKFVEETNQLMQRAHNVWKERLDFFQLMPQFPLMQQFENLLSLWQAYKQDLNPLRRKLSKQIIEYNKNVLRPIIRLYGFEKES